MTSHHAVVMMETRNILLYPVTVVNKQTQFTLSKYSHIR